MMQSASTSDSTTTAPSLQRRARLLGFISFLARVLIFVLLAALFAMLLLAVLPRSAANFGLLRYAAAWERASVLWLRAHAHTPPGVWERWILAAILFGLSRLMAAVDARSRGSLRYVRFQLDYAKWKHDHNVPDDAPVLSPVNQVLAQLQQGRLGKRDDLLKVFAETKRKLDQIGRDLAFLSIDVVDSTGIKLGEERAAVEHDFKEYKKFVEGRMLAHGSLKTTWTPDGTMACFSTVDAAVEAAKDLLSDLPAFNRDIKTMRRNFVLRCGVNMGYVYFEESLPLEEMSDRTIDIAGHLQKSAEPNTVRIAKPAIEPLAARQGFEPTGKHVLGYEVYDWRVGDSASDARPALQAATQVALQAAPQAAPTMPLSPTDTEDDSESI